MKSVSVIVPVFNTDEFIDECIDSIVNQSYKNLEIIIINDCSTDSSQEKIDHWINKDPRIIVIHNNSQKGVSFSRNLGLKKVTGDYVYFVDSDDYIDQDAIKNLVNNINNHDIAFGKQQGVTVSDFNIHNDVAEEDYKIISNNKLTLIENNSVLGKLISATHINNNNLMFADDIQRYSDLSFLIPAIVSTDNIVTVDNSIYFKRRRNDPISNPALMQTGILDHINGFYKTYQRLSSDYRDNKEVGYFLDKQFAKLYSKFIIRYFKKNENVDGVFDSLVDITKQMDNKVIKDMPFLAKREVKSLRQGSIEKFKKRNLWHHRFRRIRQALSGRTKLYIEIYKTIFLKLPIDKNIVFLESFLGKSYSDSPKYIYEYMLKNNPNYKFVWSVNEKKDIPGNPIQVKRFSLRYFYYVAKAKYWISNSRLPRTLHKREQNIYLQTWHGTPLKKLVFDMKDVHSADPAYKRNFYRQSRRWDYLSSPNEYSSNIFKRAFKFDKELLEFGYPRNDILYNKNTKQNIDILKGKLGLPKNKKVILYAPTWRDDEFYERGKYKFTLQLDLQKMQQALGDEYVVLLRMHYFIASQLDISDYEGFAYDFSSYDDIAELYLVSDLLITDYSSVFFDYANLKRPILFYTYDLDKYRETLRGFYLDVEKEVPGPLLKTTEEIIDSISNIELTIEQFQKKYDHFYNKFCAWDDGNASRKTVEVVFNNKHNKHKTNL